MNEIVHYNVNTVIQYFDFMDMYRVWIWNKESNTIDVKYMTLDEVLMLLSTKE